MEVTKPVELSCANCDTQLFEWDPIYRKWKKTREYHDAYMIFESGQKMRISLCTSCAATIDMTMGQFIMQRHYLYWEETGFAQGLELKLKEIQ